ERVGRRHLPHAAGPAGVSRARRPSGTAATATGLGSAARAAAAAVDVEALTAELVALVRIPSVTGHEDAVAATLADRLEATGLGVEVFHPDPAAIRDDPA